MFLSEIVKYKERQIQKAKQKTPLSELKARIKDVPSPRNFTSAIYAPEHVNIIAEIKRSSPSKGIICEDFDPVKIALEYEKGGAKALSVLTEKKFFKGHPSYIKKVKNKVGLSVLRKDFIIDEYQIYESLVIGADALLLISRILTSEQLKNFVDLARSLNLATLVEVHTENDMENALNSKTRIIGINNRDLHTFKIDLENTARLIKLIGEDKIVVSESGIRTNEDVMYLKSLGVHALLIGTTLLESTDRAEKIRGLLEKG